MIKPMNSSGYSNYFVTKYKNYLLGGAPDWQVEIRKIMESARKFANGKSVIEIGCGVGPVLMELAKIGYECYGIDFDAIQIENARRLQNELGILNITFFNCDTNGIPFGDKSFDIVISNDVAEHLPDYELKIYFKEALRLLKKEGIIIIHTKPTKFTYLFRLRFIPILLPCFLMPLSFQKKYLYLIDFIIPSIYKIICGKNMENTWKADPPGHTNCHVIDELKIKIGNVGFYILLSETFDTRFSKSSKLHSMLKTIISDKYLNNNIFIVAKKRM